MKDYAAPFHRYAPVLFLGVLTLAGLYIISLYNYPLFHSLAELFAIIIAGGIFVVIWNSRRFIDNNYLLFIGIAYLFVAFIDLIHTLAYKGMGVFPAYDANLPTQLWIMARYMESISLLIAPIFLHRKLRPALLFAVYTLITVLLLLSVFYWNIFPTCYIEGQGLTEFKILSEYIISLTLTGSLVSLLINRRSFDNYVLGLLIASIIFTIVSELAFTAYVSVYGFANMLGHLLKLISFYLIYAAILVTGLQKPYNLLFRQLKLSEEKYKLIIENSRDIIYTQDAEGKFLFMSPSVKETLGYNPSELQGRPFQTIVHPDDVPALEAVKRKTFENGELIPGFAYRLYDKSGAWHWYTSSGRVVRDANGSFLYYQGIARDITKLKEVEKRLEQSENELRDININLEEKVSERTRQLDATNKELRLALAGKESLLKEVHHRVKNNLMVISSLLNLQMKRTADVAAREALRESDSRIASMALIHQQVLRSGEYSTIDCESYISNLAKNIRNCAASDRKNIKLTINIEPGIMLDLDRAINLGLIINELLSNSFMHAFTNCKKGEISIYCRRLEDQVQLAIKDNGVGICEEVDVDRPLSLGLQLVNILVKQIDGTIKYEIAEGSVFTITFSTKPNSIQEV